MGGMQRLVVIVGVSACLTDESVCSKPAHIQIHAADVYFGNATSPQECCALCSPPKCLTWNYGWPGANPCHLSPRLPLSTNASKTLHGGFKGMPPSPPAPNPSPPPSVCAKPAHIQIHAANATMHVATSAQECCALCIPPKCLTWSYGWQTDPSKLCHLSPGLPLSKTASSTLYGGIKGVPTPPPSPSPPSPSPKPNPPAPTPWSGSYTRLAGVMPLRNKGSALGVPILLEGNHSLKPCMTACDAAADSCQGFSVDSWATKPPSSCQLHSHIDRLVNAPCDLPAAQLSAFFVSPHSVAADLAAPYEQFAGLVPLHYRTSAAARINIMGDLSVCTAACDSDPLCVGITLEGCSPEAPGPTCQTFHQAAVPSLVANTAKNDHACYYHKYVDRQLELARPVPEWSCSAPHCTFGCKFGQSQWSDGTPEFNCKMRRLAWEFGR